MNESSHGSSAAKLMKGNNMDLLIPLGVLLVWIILQAWVLPRLGVPT